MDLYLNFKKAVNIYIYMIYTPLNKLAFRLNRVKYGKGLKVRGFVHIFRHTAKCQIELGRNVLINSAIWANRIGSGDRTVIQVFDKGKITIGNDCGLSNVAISCGEYIKIGDNVMIGSGTRIYDTDFHSLVSHKINSKDNPMTKPILVDDNAFIGTASIILKGVHIGENSIVGAGSVVTKNIPANEIWAGNPAKYIKRLCEAECHEGQA
jgi:acetyltransferase-like isoleucine patch superfamily enzyme